MTPLSSRRFRTLRLIVVLMGAAAALAAAPEKWAAEVAAIVKQDAARPAPRDAIVFVGSSSIRIWRTLEKDFPGLPVLNRGIGGSELADSVHYFEPLVASCRPRLVVLYAGENDIALGRQPEQVAADFRAFCAKLDQALPAARLIFVGMKPSPSRARHAAAMQRANTLVAAECARDPRRTFLDIWPLMLDQAGRSRPELYRADQLHMNADGYAIWIKALAPLLKP